MLGLCVTSGSEANAKPIAYIAVFLGGIMMSSCDYARAPDRYGAEISRFPECFGQLSEHMSLEGYVYHRGDLGWHLLIPKKIPTSSNEIPREGRMYVDASNIKIIGDSKARYDIVEICTGTRSLSDDNYSKAVGSCRKRVSVSGRLALGSMCSRMAPSDKFLLMDTIVDLSSDRKGSAQWPFTILRSVDRSITATIHTGLSIGAQTGPPIGVE